MFEFLIGVMMGGLLAVILMSLTWMSKERDMNERIVFLEKVNVALQERLENCICGR